MFVIVNLYSKICKRKKKDVSFSIFERICIPHMVLKLSFTILIDKNTFFIPTYTILNGCIIIKFESIT